jgi:hypothetical protein
MEHSLETAMVGEMEATIIYPSSNCLGNWSKISLIGFPPYSYTFYYIINYRKGEKNDYFMIQFLELNCLKMLLRQQDW